VVVAAAPAFDYAAYAQTPVESCPICGAANVSVPTIDRYGFPIGTSVCLCGFAYLNPQLSAEGYDAFYNTAYRPLVRAISGMAPLPDGGQDRGVRIGRELKRFAHTSTAARVCDVGGSHGAVAEGVCRVWTVDTMTVIDPNAEELARAQAKGFATICAQIEARPSLPPQDVIVCSQTIDHLRDPIGVLRWLHACVVPKGWLYLDIVDAPRWAASLRGAGRYEWKLDHPGYWSPNVLERAMKATGWRVAARGTYEHHYSVICQQKETV
jgi:N-acetylglucosaminyldiphosphoundecaprenol N-acetyl-beta-D-mannosaminyltransferase